MMPRNADGTWRNSQRPSKLSEAVLRARWVEAETLHLKRMGLSFEAIADQITRIGRGAALPLTPLPEGFKFSPDFKISRQACHKAFTRAVAREPTLAAEEFRKIDHARSEEMFLNLQPGIRKGNLRAVEVGIKLLDHAARINGYAAPQKHEVTGKDGKPLTLIQLLQELGPIDEETEVEGK